MTTTGAFKDVIKRGREERALPVGEFLAGLDRFIAEHNPYSQSKVIPAIGEGRASLEIVKRYAKELYYLGLWMTPQVVELLRVALDDLQARPALADRGDHLALRVRIVLGDEAVEAGEELAHGERPLLAAALDDVLEGARRGHRYSSLALISIPRSRSSVFLAHARPFERLRRM